MKYKLEVSYDCGLSYEVTKEFNSLEQFDKICRSLDKKMLRWVIKDEDNSIIKICAIHNSILNALSQNKEQEGENRE